jgi:hypothetical protein
VLYEMLAGRTPFQGSSIGEVFAAVLRDEIPPLRTLRPELPTSLEQVVHRAMARQREDRFASAYAMRVALLAAIQDVLALGPLPAFAAVEKSLDVMTPNSATIQMPFDAATADSYLPDGEPEHRLAWVDDAERGSGEQVRGGKTHSYMQTLAQVAGNRRR